MMNMVQEHKEALILIAEDEEPELEALTVKFEKAGFRISQARDGEEALEKAKGEHPDAILLDILMPKLDGWEVMSEIRKQGDWGKNVPIVILTNTEVDTDEKQGRVAKDEPALFLVKTDFTIDDVVEKARKVLE